eukprot:74224_1
MQEIMEEVDLDQFVNAPISNDPEKLRLSVIFAKDLIICLQQDIADLHHRLHIADAEYDGTKNTNDIDDDKNTNDIDDGKKINDIDYKKFKTENVEIMGKVDLDQWVNTPIPNDTEKLRLTLIFAKELIMCLQQDIADLHHRLHIADAEYDGTKNTNDIDDDKNTNDIDDGKKINDIDYKKFKTENVEIMGKVDLDQWVNT